MINKAVAISPRILTSIILRNLKNGNEIKTIAYLINKLNMLNKSSKVGQGPHLYPPLI